MDQYMRFGRAECRIAGRPVCRPVGRRSVRLSLSVGQLMVYWSACRLTDGRSVGRSVGRVVDAVVAAGASARSRAASFPRFPFVPSDRYVLARMGLRRWLQKFPAFEKRKKREDEEEEPFVYLLSFLRFPHITYYSYNGVFLRIS